MPVNPVNTQMKFQATADLSRINFVNVNCIVSNSAVNMMHSNDSVKKFLESSPGMLIEIGGANTIKSFIFLENVQSLAGVIKI